MKKNIKDQTMQALAALLPEDVAKEVLSAVDNLVEGVREELQTEYDAKLEEAYAIVAEQKQKVEEEGYKGYSEAYQIISDLRDRLEVQREEFEHALQEGYEEAYQMLVNERTKNETLEVDLYEEYDRKVKEIKEFFVEKVDLFLSQKGEEFYEQAKRDVLNDPTMAEHKVALDKILEVASNYMSEEDYHFATSAKLDDLSRQVEELRGQCKIVEAKNIRLGNENNRLNEAVRQNAQMINESTRSEQKERAKKAKTAEGRGRRNVDQVQVIAEHNVNAPASGDDNDDDTRFVESVGGEEITEHWGKLAGIIKRD
jgi:hypothetical protein